MTARQINQVLWSATGCLVAVTAAVLLAGVLLPVRPVGETAQDAGRARTRVAATTVSSLPSLDSFESAWAKPLRRSLTDAPAVGQVATPAATALAANNGIPISLAGTIGTSLALLKGPDGSIVLKSVGEQLNGADVLAIRPGEVDVRYAGRSITLTKPRETASQSPTGNPNDQ